MPNWTEDQRQAILDRDKDLLVAAAAGSGKTAVLVERIIQLMLLDKVNIDQMLIVTFTQAAAGEMRQRISAALLAQLEESAPNNDAHLEIFLRDQLNLLNRASISTLHAFCLEVVKRHFHVINIDPRFRIGDDTETTIMKTEIMEELFEEEYEQQSPGFLKLVEMFGGGKDDTPLQKLILRTYEFIQSKPEPLVWLQARVGDFNIEAENFSNCPWVQSVKSHLQIELRGAQAIFAEALELTQRPGGPSTYEKALQSDLEQVAQLQATLDEDIFSFYEQLTCLQHQRLARTDQDTDPGLRDHTKELRDQGKKVLKDIQTHILFQTPDQFRQDLNELYPSMTCLYELVQLFHKNYRLQKADKGIADFNDLEHFALEILADQEVAAEYRHQYAYIFVDEYQDSNLVQETILKRIKRPNNLFLVGDVKQSIYRFRLADPTLFLEKYGTWCDPARQQERRIDLSRNFRSRPTIIAGVNDIFRQIMSPELGEIDYNEEVYLYPGISVPDDGVEELPGSELELILIDKENDLARPDEDNADKLEEGASDVEIEARLAAAKIMGLQGQIFYDSKQAGYRPLEYRDIVVLMRATRQQADIYYETLMAAGIPVYADVDRGYFQTAEINIFINLLRIIDNKRQDIPLLSVMRSPMGGFSADDLINIRVGSKATSFYEAVEQYTIAHEDALQQRLQAFLSRLQTWKEDARYTAMDEFIWRLMLETGYFYYVGAMPGGKQRQANLRILLDRAKQYQSISLKGLFHFIKFVEKLQAGRGDMGMAKILGENENVVRIMSIHKSKGLEFPAVIVAGLGKRFNLSDTTAQVLFHKDLGLGPRYVDPELRITRDTIARIGTKYQVKLESLAEEMRIFYVACTRARDKLILLGTVSSLSKRIGPWSKQINPFQLSRGRCYLDWIGPVVMRHPDGEKLRELGGVGLPINKQRESDYKWTISIQGHNNVARGLFSPPNPIDFKQMVEEKLTTPDEEERNHIWSRLNWQYPYPVAVNIPSKIAVSQVKSLQTRGLEKTITDKMPLVILPEFMKAAAGPGQSSSFSGAAQGTILHLVMQHIDMARVGSEEQIRGQVEELVKGELLREEEAQVVDVPGIASFFRSSLGQRVLQARRVYREMPFNLMYPAAALFAGLDESDEQLLLQGVIDLYFEEDDELVLVDYKTDHITPQNRVPIIDHYQVQVKLYKQALESILGKGVKASYLYLFDCNEEVRLDI